MRSTKAHPASMQPCSLPSTAKATLKQRLPHRVGKRFAATMRGLSCPCSREPSCMPTSTSPACPTPSRLHTAGGKLAAAYLRLRPHTMVFCAFNYSNHRSEEHTSELQSLMRISY